MNRLRLEDFEDPSMTVSGLVEAGLSKGEAQSKADLFRSAAQSMVQQGSPGWAEVDAFFVPGRLEILGKHTDYAGGRSLTAALEKGTCFLATLEEGRETEILDAARSRTCRFEFSASLKPALGDWSNYPMTVARRLARNFTRDWRSVRIGLAGDLPASAGMSSSSVLMVGIFLALASRHGLDRDPAYRRNIGTLEDLSGYLACLENGQSFRELGGDRGVGTLGGSEDHTAIVCGRPGQIVQHSYAPVRCQRRIPFPPGFSMAVGASGVKAKKTGDALPIYNRLSRLARTVVDVSNRVLGGDHPHIAAALEAETPQRIRQALSEADHPEFSSVELQERLEHFLSESEEIVPAVADRLEGIALDRLGALAARSQQLARDHLRNQTPETIHLVRTARGLGATASSAFGAGFGGSVWALVESRRLHAFLDEWKRDYQRSFPSRSQLCSFFGTRAGPGALRLTKAGAVGLLEPAPQCGD